MAGALVTIDALLARESEALLTPDERYAARCMQASLLLGTPQADRCVAAARAALALAQPLSRGLAVQHYLLAVLLTRLASSGRDPEAHAHWIRGLAADLREAALYGVSLAAGSAAKSLAWEGFAGHRGQFAREHEAVYASVGSGAPTAAGARALAVAAWAARQPYLLGVAAAMGDGPLPFCIACGVHAADVKGCARCKLASYCGGACQKADYPRHKGICRAAGAE